MIVSSGNEISTILLERYPDLFFLLHYAVEEGGDVLPAQEGLKDALARASTLNLTALSTVYVYGIEEGADYTALQPWLQKESQRRLIFLEEKIEALQRLVRLEHAASLLADPQVIIRYIPHPDQLDAVIQDLMADYACDRIDVIAPRAYQGERYEQIRLELFRQSTLAHATHIESLQYPQLLVNILSNIRSWQGSFLANGLKGKFKQIPAVICGAGPSLQAHLSHLKALEDQALLIAGGSAITALSNQGIQPHLGLAFDPNRDEFERFKDASAYEMPLIYGTRLESRVFNTLNGDRGYLVSNTGGPCENHFEQALGFSAEAVGPDLGFEALSVTTMALALAVHMGCNPILFSGVDLAYSGMQRYAPGVLATSTSIHEEELQQEVKTAERHLKRIDIQGRPVSTLVKWVMESDCIASFAEKHPEVRFINLSETGLGFQGIPNRQISDVIDELQLPSLDLRALIHAETQQLKLPQVQEKIAAEMSCIAESLQRLHGIASAYRQELERIQTDELFDRFPTSTLIMLELDFEEQPAFHCLNPWVGPVLDRLLTRSYPSRCDLSEEEKQRLMVHRQKVKFQRWQELIEKQIALFEDGSVS